MQWIGRYIQATIAPTRNFLRRTKATAPPETTDTESTTEKTETTTNKYTRRGNSKFKSRKEAELEKKVSTAKNEVENASRRPSFNSGVRRSERPTRKFVRVRAGGANGTTTTAAPLSSSTLLNRRPFRVTSRRRPGSTTSSTTTTTTGAPTTAAAVAVTSAYEDEESLQDIGDIEAIEDPTLEPRVPKRTNKVQRRPLVSLKDDLKDQNPSATNEEEKKRQSKKYSATIKQNQLDELLKQKSQEESTTETRTTVEDFSPETAVAIAAHQLITAPLPNIPNYEEDYKPTRKTQATVEYKYTSRDYNQFTDSQTPSYEEYQSTPIQKSTFNGYDLTTGYKSPVDFDSTKITDFDVQKFSGSLTTSADPYTTTFEDPKISTANYDATKPTGFTANTANTANLDFIRTIGNDYSITPSGFTPRSSPTSFPNTATNQEYVRTTVEDSYGTRSDFDSKISTYLPKSTATNFQTNTVPQDYVQNTGNTFETSTQFASKTSPTYVPKFPSNEYTNTINQEYVRSTLNSFDSTPSDVNSGKISTTLAPPASTPTRYFERTTFSNPTETSPRISTVYAQSVTPSKFSRSGSRYSQSTIIVDPTGYTGIQRTSTPRYRTEKLIPVPVTNTGFSTARYTGSSQEPAYFTREYLLESPVTKTYDEEYQYLSPLTTPQTTPQPTPRPTPPTRRVVRKKIQRKISTTLRPTTEAPSSLSTTVTPRRVPSKQPFEKITKAPKKAYRPISSYDYYDDSDEKVAVKYVGGSKIVVHENGHIECLDIGNFPHPKSCKKFISCARIENGSLLGWEYICPKGLSFDPVGGICNWSAGLGCDEKDT